MSLSSYLTCNPRRVDGDAAAAAADPYDAPQPQTATCCTALQRGFASDGLAQPRFAPLRTPGSAALLADDDDDGGQPQLVDGGGEQTTTSDGKKPPPPNKVVRKCKSTVQGVDPAQLIQGPKLRRSSGMRRDWSFEDLHAGAPGNKAA
ncbi:hypothetical protein ACP70R_029107 [Stipagrostis hirtigluma subsp. patula]